jgi:hypothetical protein
LRRGEPNLMVPLVHQIVFRDPSAPELVGYVARAMRTTRRAFAHYEYRCWDLEEADEFIANHYPSEVLDAFRCLRPYSYKADLFKLCVLHTLGGWYVDAGVRMLKSPINGFSADQPPRCVVFRSTGPWDATWNCSMALLYAEPGQDVFSSAIAEVVTNCREQRYGANPLCPTMTALGRAFAVHDVVDGVVRGLVVDVRWRRFKRGFAVAPLGLIAARKPHARVGNVVQIGMHGANNYVEMWGRREVYTDG